MDNDVFEAVFGFLRQFQVDPDMALLDIASAPFGFHLLDAPVVHLDTEDLFPFLYQRRDDASEVCPIPVKHDALTLGFVAVGADV